MRKAGASLALVLAIPITVLAIGRGAAQTSDVRHALTTQEIQDAIDAGVTGDPRPYLLHHVPPVGATSENPTVVGAVYTRVLDPIWEREAAPVLASYGATLPFPDARMVAAFPTSVLVPNGVFVVYRHEREGVRPPATSV